jgi:hypothetical protein
MEALLGATVAARTGLGVGARFAGSHGVAEGGPVHGDSIYTVGTQAASPAYETARLFRMIVGADVIRAFRGVVLATAALSLFIALYHALNERAYDIAVLCTLGARRSASR